MVKKIEERFLAIDPKLEYVDKSDKSDSSKFIKELGPKEEDQKRTEIVTKSFVDKFKAIQLDLIAALQAAGKMQLATEFCESLPQSPAGLHNLFGGGGLEQLKKLVKGSVIEKGFNELMTPFDEEDK